MADPDEIRRAREELDAGRLVVIPTDTVYGIAARPDDPAAIAAVFAVKERPSDKPLPILAATPSDLDQIALLGDLALRAARHWPGPLTLVVPRAPGFDFDLGGAPGGGAESRGGGAESQGVAVRVPACEVALELLRASGPLAVTSANLSGDRPATTVSEARAALGAKVRAYLDGGVCAGRPSTVVSLVGDIELLRAGPIPFRQLVQELG
jgi:tRNA threonylcarbamoyl adenosine modification protein (Sua5/YciO/YrdC/YwlC family)